MSHRGGVAHERVGVVEGRTCSRCSNSRSAAVQTPRPQSRCANQWPTKRLPSCHQATMFPTTSPPTVTAWTCPVGLASTLPASASGSGPDRGQETAPAAPPPPRAAARKHLEVCIVDITQQHICHAGSSAGESASSVMRHSVPSRPTARLRQPRWEAATRSSAPQLRRGILRECQDI